MRLDAAPLEDFSMWAAFQSGGQTANISALKELVEQWVKMATQKTAGQRGGKDLSWDNLERVKMGILCEAVALVLSGKLDGLEVEDGATDTNGVGKDSNVPTNAGRIRAMSDRELATFLERISIGGDEPWEVAFKAVFCDRCPTVEVTDEDGKHYHLVECDFEDGVCPHGRSIPWWLRQPQTE